MNSMSYGRKNNKPHSIKRALNYNEQKVLKGNADCIYAGNYLKDADKLNFHQKLIRFTDLIALNERAKKSNTLHISLNFGAGENIDKEKLIMIAKSYMEKIGFGKQPYLVYEHKDAGHQHIHIVTSNIEADGNGSTLTILGVTSLKKQERKSKRNLNCRKHQEKSKSFNKKFSRLIFKKYCMVNQKRNARLQMCLMQ